MSTTQTSGRYAEDDSVDINMDPRSIKIDLPANVVVRTLFIILAFGVGVLILRQLASFFVTLLVASFLAVAADPAVRWMQRKGLGRTGAVMTLLLTILVAFGLVLLVFVPPVVSQGDRLVETTPGYIKDVRASKWFTELDAKYDVVDKASKQLEKLPSMAGKQVGSIAAAFATGILGAFTVLFMMVLLLLGGGQLVRGTVTVFPHLARRRYWALVQGAYTNIGAYVGGTLIVATCAGTTMVISLLALGIPYAGPLSLWMFLFGIIPLVGATIGAVPALLVAFAAGGVFKGLILLGIVIAYQQAENLVIQPKIQGRVVSLPPIVIFLSVLIGSNLLGVLGALIAVPAAGIVQIFIRQVVEGRAGDRSIEDLSPIAPEPPDPPSVASSGDDDPTSSSTPLD